MPRHQDWIRFLPADEIGRRLVRLPAVCGGSATEDQQRVIDDVMPLIHERMDTLDQAAPVIGFLFVPDDRLVVIRSMPRS